MPFYPDVSLTASALPFFWSLTPHAAMMDIISAQPVLVEVRGDFAEMVFSQELELSSVKRARRSQYIPKGLFARKFHLAKGPGNA